MLVDKASENDRLPYLCLALADFINHYTPLNAVPYLIGGQCSTAAHSNIGPLKIQVWTGVHLQVKSLHKVDEVMSLKLVNACPPCDDWLLGLYDRLLSIMTGQRLGHRVV